jgi:hypothetical protein
MLPLMSKFPLEQPFRAKNKKDPIKANVKNLNNLLESLKINIIKKINIKINTKFCKVINSNNESL